MKNTSNVMLGQFMVDGAAVTVEVPCGAPGAGARETYAALEAEVRKLYPDAQSVRRIGSKIEKREKSAIRLTPGQTVRQLFPQNGDERSLALHVGQVFFSGASCDVILRFSRGQDRCHVTLRDRLRGTPVNITGGYILGGALATGLVDSITRLLGPTARELTLRIQ